MSQKSHATDTGKPAGTASTHHADRTYASGTVMPALRQRFFDSGLIAVTVLRKPGVGGNNFEQCAPIFATMRVKRATIIPGARSTTLLP